MTTSDVLIVGGGVIGLGIAWRCRQRGVGVTVIDPAPGSGASWTAAGMLAPVTELHYGEQALLRLNLDSAARYPEFAAELEEAGRSSIGYRRSGTVVAAWDGADLAALRDLAGFARTLGRDAEQVTGRQLRQLVPGLAPGLPGGLVAADDHQVDNRLLHAALFTASQGAGVQYRAASVHGLVVAHDTVLGVQLADGDQLTAGTVVLAAGAWSRRFSGLDDALLPPVRPIKGQTLRVRLPDSERDVNAGLPIVRGSVKGNPVYLVPRGDGRIVVGASTEEAGFNLAPRAGAVYELLRDAQSLLPVIAEAELEEISTSVRPGSPDNAPLIGASGVEGLLFATGHYRNGILLTPVTADATAQLIADGTVDPIIEPFAPTRFAASLTAASR